MTKLRPVLLAFVLVGQVMAAAPAGAQEPSHDLRLTARQIPSLPYTDTVVTRGATTEAWDFLQFDCRRMGSSVWYRFTATEDGDVAVDTFGSDFDTVVVVWPAGGVQPITCSDDAWGTTLSRAIFRAQAGQTYEIQVGGFATSSGNLVVNADRLLPPPNDLRAAAVDVPGLPFVHAGTNEGASTEADDPAACALAARTVWYRYTPQADVDVVLTARGAGFAPVLAVFTEDLTTVVCDAARRGHQAARVLLSASADTAYLIQLGGRDDAAGAYTFEAVEAPDSRLDEAIQIDSVPASLPFDTTGVEDDATQPRPCGGIGATIWFAYTADEDGALLVDTHGSGFDTVVAVYDSALPDAALACNDDGTGRWSDLVFEAAAGRTYLIQAGGWYGRTGKGVLNVNPYTPGPPSEIQWPDADVADIRPGSRIVIQDVGQCTANFVFRGTGHRSDRLYLGTAAHCVGENIGNAVRLRSSSGTVIGNVAFSAWKESGHSLGLGGSDRDFALIELDPAVHGRVHPSMIHFGGPTGLMPVEEVAAAQKVATYGNSGLRYGVHPSNHREGYVTSVNEPWTVYVFTVTPAVWGDSGSGMIMGDGRALGVVVTLGFVPPGSTGITALSTSLDLAATTGWDVDLQTWALTGTQLLPGA